MTSDGVKRRTSRPPAVVDVETGMEAMLERGRAAFAAYLAALPPAARPIGGATMRIICEVDFLENVRDVMAFVHEQRATVYLLDASNDLAVLMSPFSWRR